MVYPFTQTELDELESIRSSAEVSGDYSSVYKYILFHTSEFSTPVATYQDVTLSDLEQAEPIDGVGNSVWLWARGAYQVNDPNITTFFSEYIRDYTLKQHEIRYGRPLNVNPDEINDASDDIADAFASDIIQNFISDGMPNINRVGETDAGSVASIIFNGSSEYSSLDYTANYSPWAGTILFPYLGEGDFFREWVLTDSRVENTSTAITTDYYKALTGTYDLISIAKIGIELSASAPNLFSVGGQLFLTAYNNDIGLLATNSLLGDLKAEATTFFKSAYGVSDESGFDFEIGGDLPLLTVGSLVGLPVGPNYILGSLTSDRTIFNFDVGVGSIKTNNETLLTHGLDIVHAGLGSDIILGSTGNDLIDGGEGTDTLSYEELNAGGLTVRTEDTNGMYDYRFVVNNDDFTDLAYSIEELILSYSNDILLRSTLSNTTVDLLLNGSQGWDTADYTGILNGGISASFTRDFYGNTGTINSGANEVDTLRSFEGIRGTGENDTFYLNNNQVNMAIDGDGGFNTISFSTAGTSTVVDFVTGTMDLNHGQYGSIKFDNIDRIEGDMTGGLIRMDKVGNSFDFTGSTIIYDYSSISGSIEANVHQGIVTSGASADNIGLARPDPTLLSGSVLFASSNDDTLTVDQGFSVPMMSAGLGDDTIILNDGSIQTYLYMGGNDTFVLNDIAPGSFKSAVLMLPSSVDENDVSFDIQGSNLVVTVQGMGSITMDGKVVEVEQSDGQIFEYIDARFSYVTINGKGSFTLYDPEILQDSSSQYTEGGYFRAFHDYTYYGTSASDTINVETTNPNAVAYGYGGDDIINGSTANDIIFGHYGDDKLYGNGGNDSLYGGHGDDTLVGGAGDDTLYGGAGNDVYIFTPGGGFDTVYEEGGNNTLKVTGGLTLNDVTFQQIGNDLFVEINSGFTIKNQFSGDPATIVEWISFDNGTVVQLPNPLMQTNQPPIAVGDQYTGDLDVIITGNVLNNDSDPNGDILRVEPFTEVTSSGATVEMLESGDFTYTPAAGFEGLDTFEYTLSDGDLTDTAIVSITIMEENNAPDANEDSYEVFEENTLIGNVLDNDSDPDGDAINVIPADIITANGGSVMLLANGEFFYSPAANYNGPDSFNYTVQDGDGGSATASVNIDVLPVNDAPDAIDDFITAQEDIVATGNVLSNDTDIDGDALSTQAETITTLTGGTVVLDANGNYTYTPTENYNGSDSFEYTVVDSSGATDTAFAFIEIEAVNDAPEAFDDSFAGIENSEIEGNLLADNGNGVDFDLDGDALRVGQAISASTQGGSVIIMANGDFTYMPPAGYSGADSFEYTIFDDQGGSDTATVDIYLEPLNNPPEARDDSFDGVFDLTITGNVLEDNGNGADSDPDGDALAVQPDVIFTSNGGIVTLNDDGSFAYTPADGYYGQDSFDYTVVDEQGASATASATVTIEQPDQLGDDGFDLFFGSRSDDVLAGLDGTDLLFGRNGNDLLSGGDGHDLLHGNNGNDTLIGGADKDYLFGGKGNDAMYGGTGNDRLLADKGDDLLDGGDGKDYLDGGKGNDVLRGGDGSDYLKGGKGADTFKFGADEEGVDRIKDFSGREGDAIDISDVLVDDYDPVADLLSNYVTVERQGKDSVLKVDADGAGTGHEMEVVAIINNNRNLDAQEMYDQGSLII